MAREAKTNGGGNLPRQENESEHRAVVEKHFNWNNLHVAASNGETELVQKLLQNPSTLLNSTLCETLDSHQRSPLHLASANGHVEIVKLLAKANPKMCLACDRDGLNPFHAAAVAGQVDVMDALFEANPWAARARVDKRGGDTILHLCVKYYQLDFLQKLLKKSFISEEFVNATDHAGNTILHHAVAVAVAKQNREIIELVLNETGIDVNATNSSKQTAMDILHLGRKKGTEPQGSDRYIEVLLQKKQGKEEKDLTHVKWFTDKRNSLIIVAILMATIAFQAGVNPPGGVWVDNSETHKAGEAVMVYNNPHSYAYFIRCNTIGLVASLITITFLISGLGLKKRYHVGLLVVVMCVSITSLAFTYAYSIIVFTPKLERKLVDHTVAVAVIVWFAMQGIFLLVTVKLLIEDFWSEKRAKVVDMIQKFCDIRAHGGRVLGVLVLPPGGEREICDGPSTYV